MKLINTSRCRALNHETVRTLCAFCVFFAAQHFVYFVVNLGVLRVLRVKYTSLNPQLSSLSDL